MWTWPSRPTAISTTPRRPMRRWRPRTTRPCASGPTYGSKSASPRWPVRRRPRNNGSRSKSRSIKIGAAQSSGDAAALARFVGLYGTIPGPLGEAGREARLMLAERLLDERDRGLEAELHLHYLRQQTDSPEIAARARYDLARLLTRRGLLAEAVDAYRALARDFPAVAVHDGKTAAVLLNDLANDKHFVAYLDDPFAAAPPAGSRLSSCRGSILRLPRNCPARPRTASRRPPTAATSASASTPRRSPSRSSAGTGPPRRGRSRCRSPLRTSTPTSITAPTRSPTRRRTTSWSSAWVR